MRSQFKRLIAGIGLAGLLIVPGGAAWAEDPVTLNPTTKIVDTANSLGSRTGEVSQAIQALNSDHGIVLHVVIVDSFTNPTDRKAWVTDVAETAGIGSNSAILAIASGTRQLYLGTANDSKITEAQRTTIQSEVTGPPLSGSTPDYAQAAIDTATALGKAADGGNGTLTEGSGSGAGVLVGAGVVAAGGIGTFFYLRNRRRNAARDGSSSTSQTKDSSDPLAGLSLEELRRKSGSMLIEVDNVINSSEQELGFAQAQYGDSAVGNFNKALTTAKAHMSESFKLQQQLDDHIPDTKEQQRTWLTEIIRRSEAALASLNEQKADFDSLRELEKNAPEALAAVAKGVNTADSQAARAEQTLDTLRTNYAESALIQIQDNISQAKERLDFVRTASSKAQEQLSAGEAGLAAVAVRAAEEGLHQSTVLLGAIDRVASNLDEAKTGLERAVVETSQDLAQAKALIASGSHPELTGPTAGVEAALAQVKIEIEGGKIDPIATLQRVEAAHSALDESLTGIRNQQEQSRRAQASLQQAIMSAQSQIGATSDYITARRGGVGTDARTRLAESQRNLDYALSVSRTDPVTALTYAQQAHALASQAAQLAQSDVEGFGSQNQGFGGGMYSGQRGGGSGLGGAILGGLLINSIFNSGGGGWGGGGGGGDFGGGGGGGGDFGGGGWGGDGGGGIDF